MQLYHSTAGAEISYDSKAFQAQAQPYKGKDSANKSDPCSIYL